MAATPERVVLASASVARAALLRAAKVEFSVDPAGIDETALKIRARGAGDSPLDCALSLAIAKALTVARRHPGALVIGGDQLLAVGDEWFDKPHDSREVRQQLRALRGREHSLATAACVVKDGAVLWRGTSIPTLKMRRFSEAFLEAYIAAEGASLLASVGAYRLEDRGVQLFERVDGDHFAILGLPLIELLAFLRERGVLPE